MDVRADDKCGNCHRDFADHDYVRDSIDQYKCPQMHQEAVYGYFTGGDPRGFFPDAESCSKKELDNHRRACALFDEQEAKGLEPTPEDCPSGFIYDDNGRCIGHVLRARYGIGTQVYKSVQFFEAVEFDYTETA